MGSSLSPVLAEVFMEHLEEIAFSTANESIVPVLFKRYVDDVFAITKSGEDEAFLNHLNSLFPACISFTIEKEEDGRLPFLDALIIKEGDRLKTTVYRKPTHSDRYLHFSSHHPRSVMRGVISGMVERARAICDEEFLAKELGHIKTTFFSNGYPAALISSATTHATARPEEHVPTHTAPLLILPYYNGLGEKIKRMGRTVGFQVYFKSAASVRSIVRNDKVRMAPNEKPGVIYEILCTCSASYIGETGNSLSHRYEQHLNCLNRYKNALDDQRGLGIKRRGRPRKLQPNEAMDEAIKASAIVEHASRCDGQLYPNVIANEPDFRLRKIKEALYIRHNVVINRDKGTEYFSGMNAVLEDMTVIHGASVTGADKYTDHCPMWQDVFHGDKSSDVGDMVCDNSGNRPDSKRNIGLEIYGHDSICVEQEGIFVAMECLPPRIFNLVQTRFDTMYGAGCYQKNGFICEPDMQGINARDYMPSPCGGCRHLSVKWLIPAYVVGNLLLKLFH
ncbi:hypothetical protein M513_03591 [Trichuris suis]|uniref:Reverse transcriptase domain-containing protein n=1 Tax=Trichuris suis TaxID=68888 RepID=A0A085ME93_9BILA|nr:hypothetical protein M513_03591 [Trichuris suis]